MPTYEYACKQCGEHLEVVQSFSDAPLTECPACQGTLKKVFSPVGIAFKGSGFYKTDSRTKTGARSGGSTSGEGGSGDAGGGDKSSGGTGETSGASGDKAGTGASAPAAPAPGSAAGTSAKAS